MPYRISVHRPGNIGVQTGYGLFAFQQFAQFVALSGFQRPGHQFAIMDRKKTNLCVSADVTTKVNDE